METSRGFELNLAEQPVFEGPASEGCGAVVAEQAWEVAGRNAGDDDLETVVQTDYERSGVGAEGDAVDAEVAATLVVLQPPDERPFGQMHRRSCETAERRRVVATFTPR